MNFKTKQPSYGFTLVEIAIVLLIIGLLIGGILRGQELITSARVRNMIDQKSSLQAAMISFMDRYKMMAGDLTVQQAAIVGQGVLPSSVGNFAGDGVIIYSYESTILFQNLAASGFISCGACMNASASIFPTIFNSPLNPYGDGLVIGNVQIAPMSLAAYSLTTSSRLLLTSGVANSQVLAELDRKADDGYPGTGSFRLSDFSKGGAPSTRPTVANCAPVLQNGIANDLTVATAPWANPAFENCMGAWLL